MSELPTREPCLGRGVFQRILVAVNDSDRAQWAIEMAGKMAKASCCAVALVHVIPSDACLTPEFALIREGMEENRRATGLAVLARAAAKVGGKHPPELMLKEGEPSQQIIAAAREWHPDVIVIGTHGRGPVAHMMLGSTAESVVRHAHAPVLTVGCDPNARPQPVKGEAAKKLAMASRGCNAAVKHTVAVAD